MGKQCGLNLKSDGSYLLPEGVDLLLFVIPSGISVYNTTEMDIEERK